MVSYIFGMLFTMLRNVSVIRISLLAHILKEVLWRQALQCCFIPCHKETFKNYFCNGKIRTILYTICFTFAVNTLIWNHLQRCSYCHAVFNIQIYLKYFCAIYSKNFILDLTFNSLSFYSYNFSISFLLLS